MKININDKIIKIPEDKKYTLPDDITAKFFKGFMVLVSPSCGKWIVLNSQTQINIFKSLMNGATVNEVVKNSASEEEVKNVLIQIEGKLFAEKFSSSSEENFFALRLYLTNNCNLRCRHCFMYASTAMNNELSTTEIYELLENCKSYGCSKVIFTGGEVLMRKDFYEIVKFTANLKMYVQILTNGTLWNEEKISEIAPFVDEVQISIDGFNEETNSEIKELIDGRELRADTEKNKIMEQTVNSMYEKIYENSELTTFILNHKNNRIYKNCGYGNLTVNSVGDVFFCGRVFDVKKICQHQND